MTWARRLCGPTFLANVTQALPPSMGHLYRQAVDGGDPVTFYAMLDAAEEAGAPPPRGGLIEYARFEELLPGDLPVTEDELREERERAVAFAVDFIERRARDAGGECPARRHGTAVGARERAMIYYDDTPQSERAGRRHLLEGDEGEAGGGWRQLPGRGAVPGRRRGRRQHRGTGLSPGGLRRPEAGPRPDLRVAPGCAHDGFLTRRCPPRPPRRRGPMPPEARLRRRVKSNPIASEPAARSAAQATRRQRGLPPARRSRQDRPRHDGPRRNPPKETTP
jgi:hypothetical protein